MVIAVIILAIIGGVAGFLLSQSPDPEPVTAQATTNVPTLVSENYTTAPPTNLPSGAPTELIKYDPPSEEDCDDIRSKQPVEGQQELLENSFDVLLDVTLAPNKTWVFG